MKNNDLQGYKCTLPVKYTHTVHASMFFFRRVIGLKLSYSGQEHQIFNPEISVLFFECISLENYAHSHCDNVPRLTLKLFILISF